MNTLKEKLTEAINARNNDVKSFVWKLARKADGTQEEVRLVDATPEQLQQFFNHCYSMLYSTDKLNPGRYVLLDIIKEQREKCNVELYLRRLKEGVLTGGESYPRHLLSLQRMPYMYTVWRWTVCGKRSERYEQRLCRL